MRELFGRKKIYTALERITPDNVIAELNRVLPTHFSNMSDEDYLYWYRRGQQPILERTKAIRPEINNKIVQNVADEIVAFKNGYFLTKPTFYVSRKKEDEMADTLAKLNDFLYLSGKAEADNAIVDWFHTVGIGDLFVEATGDKKVPVRTYPIDPRQAFVVYSTKPSGEPVYGVNMVVMSEDEVVFDVWSKEFIFHITGGSNVKGVMVTNLPSYAVTASKVVSTEVNAIGEIPIIEYTYNRNRMGAFENVIGLCDAINETQSDRENGVQQFIQSLMVLTNCTLGEDEEGNPATAQSIRESGLIELKSNSVEGAAKIDILTEQLDQTQTQVLIDDMLHQICNIAGMPFTTDVQGGTSDNTGAVYLRNGWQTADTFARNTEDLFKASNKLFDRIFFKILAYAKDGIDIDPSDVDIQFTRNEMDNMVAKSQVALNLKTLGMSPELVLEKSGLSNDPAGDYARSKKYMDVAFSTETKTEDDTQKGAENESDNIGQSEMPDKRGN